MPSLIFAIILALLIGGYIYWESNKHILPVKCPEKEQGKELVSIHQLPNQETFCLYTEQTTAHKKISKKKVE